jgi:Na+/glutamate symporter
LHIISSIGSFFVSLPALFKEHVFDFKKFFALDYLNQSAPPRLRYALPIAIVIALISVAGIVMQVICDRRSYPKFYKRYLKRIGNFLIYIPIALILVEAARLLGLEGLNRRIVFVGLVAIWLIWLIYLIYYRLVYVNRLWGEYHALKRKEQYFHGSKN